MKSRDVRATSARMSRTPSRALVLILDFGSQVTQLIARRVREAGVAIKDLATEDPDLEDVFLALTYADPTAADPTKD